MMEKIKRLIALILALAMSLALLGVNVWASDEPLEDTSVSAQSSEETEQQNDTEYEKELEHSRERTEDKGGKINEEDKPDGSLGFDLQSISRDEEFFIDKRFVAINGSDVVSFSVDNNTVIAKWENTDGLVTWPLYVSWEQEGQSFYQGLSKINGYGVISSGFLGSGIYGGEFEGYKQENGNWNLSITNAMNQILISQTFTMTSESAESGNDDISDFSLENVPCYPEDGQKYWVIFKEGFRNNRVELSTCNLSGTGINTRIIWNKNLIVDGSKIDGKCNQYYYNANGNWEKIGTYGILTDWATEVIASNLDIYDKNGKLILRASNTYDTGDEDDYIITGNCGENATWSFDRTTCTLTISGSGQMEEYQYEVNFAPWYNFADEIESVVIDGGITSVGALAFYGCNNLVNAIISDSVTDIGVSSFSWCVNLSNLTLGKKVHSIGQGAFTNCEDLQNVVFPDSLVNIGSDAFSGCTKIETLSIPDSVKSIGRYSFEFCESLKSLTIGNSVSDICEGAFSSCSKLTSVVIPNSVSFISRWAFGDCSKMTTVSIPKSVTAIEESAFYQCEDLSDVYYDGSETDWSNIQIQSNNECLTNATIHYNSSGTTPPSEDDFDQFVYRADFYLDNHSDSIENLLFEQSVSKELYKVSQEQGLADSARIWDELTSVLDAVDDPSTIPDTGLKKKDMYSGLILSVFEASVDKNAIDNIDVKQAKQADSFYSFLKNNLITKLNIDLTKQQNFNSLTQAQKEKLLKETNDWIKKHTGVTGKGMDAISTALDVFSYVQDASEYCKYVSGICTIYTMNESLKKVMKDMYEACPDNYYDLKWALYDCSKTVSSSCDAVITQLVLDGSWVTVKDVAQFGISKLWKEEKASLAASNPYVAAYWVAYSGSKFLCNSLLNTDKLCEKYFMMECILRIEEVLDKVYSNNKSAYIKSRTTQNAEVLLSTMDVMFQCYDVDCDTAYAFVDAEEDTSVIKVLNAFGRKDGQELKKQIQRIQSSVKKTHEAVSTSWAGHLQIDYPELYDKYSDVLKHDISECNIHYYSDTFYYSGTPLTPSVKIDYSGIPGVSGVQLVEGTDYVISYSNNVNVGTATMVIYGTGDMYKGSVSHTFEILPFNIQNIAISPDTGAVNDVNLDLRFLADKLSPKTDYSTTWSSSNDGVHHTVTIYGRGNFTGTLTKEYKHTWNSGKVTKQATYTSNGVRTYTCTACGDTRTESIAKLDYDDDDDDDDDGDYDDDDDYDYDDDDYDDYDYDDDHDYDNKPTTKEKLKATKLTKVTVKKKTATVTWKKNTTGKGYQLQCSTNKKFKKPVKTYKIGKNTITKATIKKLKKGTYYLRIRTIKGKKHSGWSKIKKVKVK